MIDSREIVVGKNGQPRQAGTDPHHHDLVDEFRKQAEKSLFTFGKGVLGKHFFSADLHLWVCNWLQKTPPFRKLLMLPRLCCKTAIGSHCLPIHLLIQPADGNIYFPGLLGTECRILLAGETETRAKDHLRVLQTEFEGNQTLRALWPEACWDNPKRQSKKWNEKEMILPRTIEYPDPSIRGIGVGGAITGARPNVIIKDDLISLEAANSQLVMETAIEWHKASRALLDKYDTDSEIQALEFILGTHWANWDLYTYIEEEDPSVEIIKRSFYEMNDRGEPEILWAERYTWEDVEQIKREQGARFWLMYMNQPMAGDITDFDMTLVRRFDLVDGAVEFDTEIRDKSIELRAVAGARNGAEEAGPDPTEDGGFVRYDSGTHDRLFNTGPGRFFNEKYMSEWREDSMRRREN